jgi:uncharacterized protein (UPF0335 family)
VTVGGSQQLRIFRRAIRDGSTVEDAAAEAGMSLGEARLHAADDAKNPPPPEAYELLGHNSEGANMSDSISAEQLRLLIERVERLEEEKKGIAEDIKDVLAEAKSTGFDVKTIRTILRLRKMEPQHRSEAATLLETYCNALGMQAGFGF